MATAIEKIQNLITKIGTVEDFGSALATAIKARKKADLKVVSFGENVVTVATDEGDTLRVVLKADAADAHLKAFSKRKSTVMLPKTETAVDLEDVRIDKIEKLVPLKDVIGDEDNAAFTNWMGRYATARQTGKATRGAKTDTAPDSVKDVVHIGNLRGLVDKIVQYNGGAMQMKFDNFSVRENEDGTKQLVITDLFAAA